MQIEIHGETERVIQEQVKSGRYPSPEAVIDAAVVRLVQPSGGRLASRRDELEARIKQHGIQPLVDGTELYGDFWPEDQSVNEFLEAIDRQRQLPSRRLQDVQEAFE
jgi:Arc/MetJ-type ribon-helix-helix transcriptional regulator